MPLSLGVGELDWPVKAEWGPTSVLNLANIVVAEWEQIHAAPVSTSSEKPESKGLTAADYRLVLMVSRWDIQQSRTGVLWCLCCITQQTNGSLWGVGGKNKVIQNLTDANHWKRTQRSFSQGSAHIQQTIRCRKQRKPCRNCLVYVLNQIIMHIHFNRLQMANWSQISISESYLEQGCIYSLSRACRTTPNHRRTQKPFIWGSST